MSQSTLTQFLQKQDNIYLDAEKTWNSLTIDTEKKYMSWQHLSWCKKMRDYFDNFTSEHTLEDEDTFINQHESTWATRVTIWRQRFNEWHP